MRENIMRFATDGREVCLAAQVGSYNYNLQDENSDQDFKVFVLPTFEDLYRGKMFATARQSDEMDYDVHDIRKLIELLWKSNPNFIEVLFSDCICYRDQTGKDSLLVDLVARRDEIVTMNMPYFYQACQGLHFTKMTHLDGETAKTKHLVEQYGYDTKQALHAYRAVDLLIRFETQNFKDYRKALVYEDDDRELMMKIKHGGFSKREFEDIVREKWLVAMALKESYQQREPNTALRDELDSMMLEYIRKEIRG